MELNSNDFDIPWLLTGNPTVSKDLPSWPENKSFKFFYCLLFQGYSSVF